ncbi:MAG: threonylcarbamoyl-AMP synthase [Alphaproteobacteria bacterium]|nr:threonylcarbamoyl-AMP synthase [Alphaproteobacteria bacterium]
MNRPLNGARIVAATESAVAEAVRFLRDGRLVAFPTETVYGLGADASSDDAVEAIYRAKGRPPENPLILHVATLAEAEILAEFNDDARKLAAAFWPGAVTLVLKRRAGARISSLATAELDTVALRIPDHPVALALLRAAGRPLAAPSANPSGRVSPTLAEHVASGLGQAVSMILDGGQCRVGIESTVVALDGDQPRILRPGGIAAGEIERVLGKPVRTGPDKPVRVQAPGQMLSHYAPRAGVRLNATSAGANEGVLTFGTAQIDGARMAVNLSAKGDLGEAAANLYAALRVLDDAGVATIAVVPIPEDGIGAAINDRLRRAAAR